VGLTAVAGGAERTSCDDWFLRRKLGRDNYLTACERQNKKVNILGIDWGEHDSAACLVQDGRLIAAAEEERFNRIKHAPFAFPLRAARYCLEAGGIAPQEVDIIAFSFSPGVGLGRGVWHSIRHFPKANFIALAEAVRRAWYLAQSRYARYVLKLSGRTRSVFVPHHLAHAASAYFCSPFDQAAVLVVDGMGEWPVTSLYQGLGNCLQSLAIVNFPHSLGFFYSAFTEYFGFSPFDGEYKVMGMAAYGETSCHERLHEIVNISDGANYQLDLRYFNFHRDYGRTTWYSPYLVDVFGPASTSTPMPEQHYLDIAASVQQRLEDVLFHLVEYLYQHTRSPNLCMAGGVALNSVANGKIAQRGPFERLFVQPAASDAGCAVGAALYVQHSLLKKGDRSPLRHVYLGPAYASQDIETLLRHNLLDYQAVENPAEEAATLLARGKIVGWFQGRMEFGPRALGNRSILADPRQADMKDRINAAVKFREPFRPFAPSVTEEHSDDYFENVGGSPFMLRVTQVRPGMAERIPAVTHVNGTARLHTVNRESNPLYYDLLQRFGAKSGVPLVLNTSFNVRGEPIVRTPKEAVACFFNSGLDALMLDHFLLRKSARSSSNDSLQEE
jgi:carbamoyltransferase